MKYTLKIKQHLNTIGQILKSIKNKDSWKSIRKCDLLLMAHENDRSYLYKGQLYSHLLDSISFFIVSSRQFSHIRIASLTLPFSKIKHTDTFGDSKTINRGMLIAKLSNKLIQIISFSRLDINPEINLWRRVLRRTMPKVIIAIQPHTFLCAACRLENIQVFDFQHGLIADSMPEYGFQFRINTPVKYLPTGYLCWDEKSKQVLASWSTNKDIKIYVHGNPWIYRFKYPIAEDNLVSAEKDQFHKNLSYIHDISKFDKIILISLQPALDYHYPEYFLQDEILPHAILDAISLTADTVFWLIRLHPIQFKQNHMREKIINLFKKFTNIEILNTSKAPLPTVLSFVDGHVTWNSCVVIESAYMGIPSFILEPIKTKNSASRPEDSPKPSDFFSQIREKGLIERAVETNCTNQLIKWTNSINKQDAIYNLKEFEINSFLKDLSLDNIKAITYG